MKLIVRNATAYRTDDLEAFARAGLRAMGVVDSKVVAFLPIKPEDAATITGLGEWGETVDDVFVEGVYIRLRLPPARELDVAQAARVFEHEALHTLGVTHARMNAHQRNCTGPRPGWSVGLQLREETTMAAKKKVFAESVETALNKIGVLEVLEEMTQHLARVPLGNVPLVMAAIKGDLDEVRKFVSDGARVEATSDAISPAQRYVLNWAKAYAREPNNKLKRDRLLKAAAKLVEQ